MLFEKENCVLLDGEYIFDSHAHYDDSAFDGDRDRLLTEMHGFGVCGIINCGADFASSEQSLFLSHKHPFVYAAVGIHPESADGYDEQAIRCLAADDRAVAIGEIGLDYHWDTVPRERQIAAFRSQVQLANELGMPVIVHDREAHSDTIDVLSELRPRGVVHCFSGSAEMAEQIVRLGMYIGIGGVLTFKNARRLVDVAERVPLERILLETDAPYMAPEPYRGHRCHSGYIAFVADRLAAIRQLTRREVLAASRKNVRDLFGV